MKTMIKINGEWVDGSPTEEGQVYRIVFHNGGYVEQGYTPPQEEE